MPELHLFDVLISRALAATLAAALLLGGVPGASVAATAATTSGAAKGTQPASSAASPASASAAGANVTANANPAVDDTLDTLRKQIDDAQQALKEPDKLADVELQNLRATVTVAQSQAADIATQLVPQLAGIDARVAELGTPTAGTKEDPDVVSQRTSLNKTRGQVDSQVKLAKLLSVEGEQLAAQIWSLRRSQFQARLGTRTDSILATPFWAELRDDWPRDLQRLEGLGADLRSAAHATPMQLWFALPILFVAGVWLVRWLQRRLMQVLTTRVPPGRLRRTLYAWAQILRATLVCGIAAAVLYAALDWTHSLPDATGTLLSQLSGMLWFSGFLFGLASALISARRASWRLLAMPDQVATSLRWFPLQLTLVSLVSWLGQRLTGLVNASLSMAVAVNCVVALALGITIARALFRADRQWNASIASDDNGRNSRPIWLMVVAGLNWLVLVTATLCLLAGYVAFGSFALKQVVWVAVVVGTAYLLAALIDDVLMAWLGNEQQEAEERAEQQHGTQRSAQAAQSRDKPGATAAPSTNVRNHAQFAVLLSGLLRLAVLLLALTLLLAPFGDGPSDLVRRSGEWRDGLKIGEVTLQPGSVIEALVVLVLGLAAVRWLRGWLATRYLPTTSLDPGMQTSATSLFGYAGVVVAVALAMSAMGIGLERIAWVASALSVGIGFGLQAVVQNFVSGLILLAERPVKVGDWVSLGGVEGDIRRINVRATEIQMGDRSTVIVPNSEFITKVVRNVTLADPLGLVQVKLPVPLGTDADQVRSLLLDAFTANTDVLDAPAPAVLLDGIDGGHLLFNATGFVKSPRMSGNVRSALLFDVLSRLKAADITITAPPTVLIHAQAGDVPVAAAAAPTSADLLPGLSAAPPP